MRHHARRTFAAAFVSAAPTVLAERWVGYTSHDYLVFEYIALTLFGIIGVLVGLLLKVQKAQLQEFETRSTRLALAREQAAMLAAANERSRIAREMHDVVAHSLAVMITMSDGAISFQLLLILIEYSNFTFPEAEAYPSLKTLARNLFSLPVMMESGSAVISPALLI